MSMTARSEFLVAVRKWASDIIRQKKGTNTELYAAALEYAKAVGYRLPEPPPPPDSPASQAQFKLSPDYRVKIGNAPQQDFWHCRQCGVLTPYPSAHICKGPSPGMPMLRRPPHYDWKTLELHSEADRITHTITTVYQCNRCHQIYDKPTQHWCDPTREEDNTNER